ncbi:MAG: hypothetical protein A3F72_14605 [Bacteroidetes bacterium RIFCSPLOWO2_12_FULL_35_15]|nr:MAG: hypothetical protein A3F72_14605 [Bacteroidetes bacterium RIFCSPLOWO2_12_FULL_35_15]
MNKDKNSVDLFLLLGFIGACLGILFPVTSLLLSFFFTFKFFSALEGSVFKILIDLHASGFYQIIVDCTPFLFLFLVFYGWKFVRKSIDESHTDFRTINKFDFILTGPVKKFMGISLAVGLIPFLTFIIISFFKEDNLVNKSKGIYMIILILIALTAIIYAIIFSLVYLQNIQLKTYLNRTMNYKRLLLAGIASFLIGWIIPVVLWAIDISQSYLPFNFESIGHIHSLNNLHWLFDITPFAIGNIVLVGGLLLNNSYSILKSQLIAREESIDNVRIFAEQIGEGNLDSEIKLAEGDENLTNAIIRMRDNLRKSDEEEKDRQWSVEGLANLGEVLRAYSNKEELSYHVLIFLIRKIRAIQGAFYITELDQDEKATIKMVACYSYDRKKFVSKTFKFGEGLVGQAALEKEYIYRTEIPADYATFTSGLLGDKKPKSLFILPLISNEKLFGLIEFASLNSFEPLEISFLKEVSLVIAQTIFNLNVNEQTSKLLDDVNKSHKLMQGLLENASEVITIYEKDGTARYVSPSIENIFGYSTDEIIGRSGRKLIHPKGRDTFDKLLADLLEFPSQTFEAQFSYTKKNGARIWTETTGKNMLNDPAIQGLVLNTRDITMRRKAEKEEKKRGQMQALSENSIDLIMRLDTNGQLYYANPVIERFFGKNPEYFLHKDIRTTGLADSFVDLISEIILEVSETRKNSHFETTYITGDGKKVLNINAIPEFNEDNNVETILFVAHDITEAKLIEQQIQVAHKKITESINYAHRIQRSILPTITTIKSIFPESFMMYLPKDIVSGDFPWIKEKGDYTYLAAVDCTGHGVPGALMSFIGYFILNEITVHEEILDTGIILDRLHKGVQQTLKQDSNDSDSKDGMDIAFCRFNTKKKELQFSGAHRPLYYVHDNLLTEIKADKYPIGGMQYKTRKEFVTHTINYSENDSVFFFTDGLPDQFNVEGHKFMSRQVKEIIENNQDKSFEHLSWLMETTFEKWKGDHKQMDDVLLIGIKF